MSLTLEPAIERALRVAVAPIRRVQVRDASGTGDGSWTIEGYAAVFEQATILYDGKWFVVREVISRDAFHSVLSRVQSGDELVHLNHGHDMTSSVAATDVAAGTIGGLELSADEHGLRFFARVDVDDPDAIRMAVKLRRKVIAQASFAFTIAEEELTIRDLADGREEDFYRILEIGHLYDVCVCAQGAYPQTESSIRSLAAASLRVPLTGTDGRSPEEGQQHRSPEGEGANQVAPDEAGPGESKSRQLERLQAAAGTTTRSIRKGLS